MATHFSILAWRITWTEEPGGLQSMVSQSVQLTKQLTLSFLVPPEKYGKTNLGCFQNTESVSGAW